MSWRFLISFIVIMLAVAGFAGFGMGDWLVSQAPGASNTTRTNIPVATLQPQTDASGRTIIPEPPQPLIDGSLGVPQPTQGQLWELQAQSLFDGFIDPMVIISREGQSYTVGDMLSQAGQDLPQGPTDIQTLDVTSPSVASVTATVPITAPEKASQSWQDQLKAAVETCEAGSFFGRPNCLEKAREKFCTPNQGWGRHPLCPTR
jgi:hypothetical protein